MTDDSTAEKAWQEYMAATGVPTKRERRAFMAGRASRDTRVAELENALLSEGDLRRKLQGDCNRLREQLAERTASADAYSKSLVEHQEQGVMNETRLREQLAEAQATIEKVRALCDEVEAVDGRDVSSADFRDALSALSTKG